MRWIREGFSGPTEDWILRCHLIMESVSLWGSVFFFFHENYQLYDKDWASQVAQWVKNLPAMQETQEMRVWPLPQESPLEESMATHSSILAWRIPLDRGAWRATVHSIAESDTTEATKYTHTHTHMIVERSVVGLAHIYSIYKDKGAPRVG